ncbi:beta-ketoacyl synthase [uncultured Alistipes sp.]|nr:beta-ketoacyl-[acyl-carrier-protein] synthase family protein [uncultured Alistipes sp.]
MKEPIWITGAGIVSAVGCNKREVLESLVAGRSGIGPMRYLRSVHIEFPVGEVPMSDEELCAALGIDASTPTIRTALLGMLALGEALDEAGLSGGELPGAAFISGTTVGGMDRSECYYPDFLANDSRNEYIAMHDCGASTELIADRFGRFGFVSTPSTACSSAMNAILVGANLIRSGAFDIVVAGGSECLTRFHLNGFNALMILDTQPCRPFDATRAGLNLGEGAAYVVLERAASARRRGVHALATLDGVANTCDAFHQTASSADGEGAFRAMRGALADAGLNPSEVDYINAHGTGTPNNDASESAAMLRLFGDRVPPVSSTKAFTGHTTSASGAIETVICLLALRYGFLPVNLNWQHPMDNGIVPVRESRPPREIRHVLCNSFGFGGNDSSLLLSKWQER